MQSRALTFEASRIDRVGLIQIPYLFTYKAHSVIRRTLNFRRRLWEVGTMKISPKYPVIRRTQNYGKFVDHVRCTYNNLLPKVTNYGAFELPATRTLEFTGNRTVLILSCGGDKQSFTVVLAVKADGEKLPPKVVFKGVRQLQIEVPRRTQVSVHKKARMDEEG